MSTTPERRRRSTAEVRTLIMNAARQEFAESGYAHTSVRAVARRAGVTESTLFRHFASKSDLFQTTSVDPLIEFIKVFSGALAGEPADDPMRLTEHFVSGFYDVCVDNRRILLSLAVRQPGEGSDLPHGPIFESCVESLATSVRQYVRSTGNNAAADLKSSVELTLALVLGAALNGDEIFSDGLAISDLKSHLSRFILFGTGYRPASTDDH